jgi:type 1 glutamine amidotransferase
MIRAVAVILGFTLATSLVTAQERPAVPKKVVLVAGPKSHGPIGNGIHDYPWSVKLLKVMLDNSNVRERVRVEYHLDGWPADPATLDDADAIMVISDGRDGDRFAEAPHFETDEHREVVQRQIDRGCGFLTFHFSTFAPDEYAAQILDWTGGYFDWETDGQREWYSDIQTIDGDVELPHAEHPVCNGVEPFSMNEEFYYNIRFADDEQSAVPILSVPALPGREPDGRVVAWVRERENGGRGFGTTCGHFYDNWRNDDFRTVILNAIVWAAGGDVPPGGVTSRFYTHEEITRALAGVAGTVRAELPELESIAALILTGHQYPGHVWQQTTPALVEALTRDPRIIFDVSEDIEDLASDRIQDYDLLVLNYCNWKAPGLSDAAKAGLVDYLAGGGGLIIIHFANGAFHFSLPEAGDSDWPEYRNICRRVWDHTPGMSGHDSYGPFIVEIADPEHPITAGLEPFQTMDELYFRQQGDQPIHVVAQARSGVTGEFEPMAFVYDYERGRVFQTVLGHAAESIRNPGTAELISRAAAWVAGKEPAHNRVP